MNSHSEVLPRQHKMQSWFLAARPKTLTAALAPVMVATVLARAEGFQVDWFLSLVALLSSFCIQIGTNLVNDAIDFKKGADNAKRIGPKRVTQQGLLSSKQVLFGGYFLFAIAFVFAIPLMVKGGESLVVIVLLSILSGYLYTGGPFPLAYVGLGDLFVILFFGLISTTAIYYVQTLQVNLSALLAGLQVGLLCTVMIVVNNLRDREEDEKVGKKTLAVRLGKRFSRFEVTALVVIPFVLGAFWIKLGFIYAGILPFMTVILAYKLVLSVWNKEPGAVYNIYLGFAALLHILFTTLLCVGLLIK